MNDNITNLLNELDKDPELRYILIAGKNGVTTNKSYALQKNSAYNLIFAFLSAFPHLLPDVADAVNDLKSETGVPHLRPE